GGGAAASSLDVLQGDPARVRDLDVGFSSLRTIRAEAPAAAPRVAIELRLAGRTLSGTVRNLSDETLERPSVVLGSSVAVLSDLPPGAERQVRLTLAANPFGPSLADRIVGQVFFDDPRAGRNQQALLIRRQILDQLSYDAMFGVATRLPADGPVLLAFGSRPILDVTVDGHETRRTSTVLYYIPASLDVAGEVTFGGDLLRATPIAADALFFNQDFGGGFTFGEGSVTLAYRPIGYVGALAPRRLLVGLSFGPDQLFGTRSAKPVQAEGPAREPGDEPSDCIGEACPAPNKPLVPGPAQPPVPRVDLFDLEARAWASLPELTPNEDYAILAPERYVDPASGTVLVRLVNGRADPVSVTLNVQLEGEVQ
ncbi:MAG TPA: hypothetical protein VNJ28_02800, partial [Candidatus Limnocylindrales bacterium]|nr:hypothetical protein [Candidatus Limnocylindrales bacterium]